MIQPSQVEIIWPNGQITTENVGVDWIEAARKSNIEIPLGCIKGSCGACEIEVNGRIIRACISTVDIIDGCQLKISFPSDPYW